MTSVPSSASTRQLQRSVSLTPQQGCDTRPGDPSALASSMGSLDAMAEQELGALDPDTQGGVSPMGLLSWSLPSCFLGCSCRLQA